MDEQPLNDLLRKVASRLPVERLEAYAGLWELETWLRTMVYVELRARDGDGWESALAASAESPRARDKHLSHMPTREELPISYMQLASLLKTISEHWDLFQRYLPPKTIWDVKLEEITQIRHRVAHFRRGHRDDSDRLAQLLKDIDQGFWHFCTSYNEENPALPPEEEPVSAAFLHLDPFPWNQTERGRWARSGVADPRLDVSVTVNILRRPWSAPHDPIAGNPGSLYDIGLAARNQRQFDYGTLLTTTRPLHEHICHLCLDTAENYLRVTIPSVLGAGTVIELVEGFREAARATLRSRPSWASVDDALSSVTERIAAMDSFAERYPEYVLGPSNPLTFLDPDMRCSFFGAD